MMVPDSLFVRCVQNTDDMPLSVVVQGMLMDTKLIAFTGIGASLNLYDGLFRQHKIVMNIMKERHNTHPFLCKNAPLAYPAHIAFLP